MKTQECDVRFERENIDGVVAVGSYLSDSARRLGIRNVGTCDLENNDHDCLISITSGAELLSPKTKPKAKFLNEASADPIDRLACQTKIERSGDVVVMTKEKKTAEEAAEPQSDIDDEYRKKFAELPLDKKISNLVQLEAMALGDTLAYIANSPYTIADKLMDVLAGFGFAMDEEAKKAKRPSEHKKGDETVNDTASSKSKTASSKRRHRSAGDHESEMSS